MTTTDTSDKINLLNFFEKEGCCLKKIFDPELTVKALLALLILSFIATISGFTVAYLENKNYNALTAKYDQALETVSNLEVSVAALMAATAFDTSATSASYPAEDIADSTEATESENSDNSENLSDTPLSESDAKDESPTTQTASGTYYVTQSGKKYHTAYCSYLSKSKIAITMDRIKAEGYSPCSRCIK